MWVVARRNSSPRKQSVIYWVKPHPWHELRRGKLELLARNRYDARKWIYYKAYSESSKVLNWFSCRKRAFIKHSLLEFAPRRRRKKRRCMLAANYWKLVCGARRSERPTDSRWLNGSCWLTIRKDYLVRWGCQLMEFINREAPTARAHERGSASSF